MCAKFDYVSLRNYVASNFAARGFLAFLLSVPGWFIYIVTF